MEKINYKKYFVISLIASATCLCVLYIENIILFISKILSALSPLILGCVFAFVINILLNKVEKLYFPNTKNKYIKITRRPASITISLFIIILIIYAIIKLVIPELIACVKLISEEIPEFMEEARKLAILYSGDLPELQEYLEELDVNWQELINKAWTIIKIGAGGFFSSIITAIGNAFGGVTKIIIGFCNLHIGIKRKIV